MPSNHNPIYINTVLLEKNRWGSRIPTITVSDFMPRFRAAGFDGVELWENHVLRQPASELAALQASDFPVTILNSYAPLTDDAHGEEQRQRAAELARALKCRLIKYNFGNDPAQIPTYQRNLLAWRKLLPQDCRLLCECHGGTVMEDPAQAAAILQGFDPDLFPVLLHPFGSHDLNIKVFRHLGPRVVHAHLSIRTDDAIWHDFRSQASLVHSSLALLKAHSYAGSFSLEFTRGTAAPDETPEKLYQSAVDDLRFIRECLRN